MGFFTGVLKRGRSVPSHATFMITQVGKEKLQQFSGDPKSQILVALENRGTSDIDEISQACGLSRGQVERLIPSMVRGGYIQYVGAGSSGDGE